MFPGEGIAGTVSLERRLRPSVNIELLVYVHTLQRCGAAVNKENIDLIHSLLRGTQTVLDIGMLLKIVNNSVQTLHSVGVYAI